MGRVPRQQGWRGTWEEPMTKHPVFLFPDKELSPGEARQFLEVMQLGWAAVQTLAWLRPWGAAAGWAERARGPYGAPTSSHLPLRSSSLAPCSEDFPGPPLHHWTSVPELWDLRGGSLSLPLPGRRACPGGQVALRSGLPLLCGLT